ncbi:MAG: NAD(P)-dependent oxidoreductase [Pseudomonadales bacterium]
MKKNIGFVGLGVMGYPMAGHLVAAGHQVTVYNRSSVRAQQWHGEHGGTVADTPALAAKGADIVFSCVGNDEDVRAIALADNGVLAGLAAGGIFVDHTTTSAELARELDAACAAKGLKFMDAPVSGGQAGAENGALTIMIGGEQATLEEIEPVIDAYARKAALMGAAGNGQLAKMANQICIAGLVQGLAEGLNFAEQVGLDAANVIDVISKGAAQSWQMENRYETMLDKHYEHGFAVDWMRKDLRYAIEEGARNGAELPVTEIVDGYYSEVQSMGGSRWDTSSLLARLQARRDTLK